MPAITNMEVAIIAESITRLQLNEDNDLKNIYETYNDDSDDSSDESECPAHRYDKDDTCKAIRVNVENYLRSVSDNTVGYIFWLNERRNVDGTYMTLLPDPIVSWKFLQQQKNKDSIDISSSKLVNGFINKATEIISTSEYVLKQIESENWTIETQQDDHESKFIYNRNVLRPEEKQFYEDRRSLELLIETLKRETNEDLQRTYEYLIPANEQHKLLMDQRKLTMAAELKVFVEKTKAVAERNKGYNAKSGEEIIQRLTSSRKHKSSLNINAKTTKRKENKTKKRKTILNECEVLECPNEITISCGCGKLCPGF